MLERGHSADHAQLANWAVRGIGTTLGGTPGAVIGARLGRIRKREYDDLHYQRIKRMRRNNPELDRQIGEFLHSVQNWDATKTTRDAQAKIADMVAEHNRSMMRVVPPPAKRRMAGSTKIMIGTGVLAGGAALARSRQRKVAKIDNPHNLPALTSRGTTRKVHIKGPDGMAVCGTDGAFGKGRGPFAEHASEVTCLGCQRRNSRAVSEYQQTWARRMKTTGRGLKVIKADYPGASTSPSRQRAAIYGAGAAPLVGPIAGAKMAGHFAPPGQQRRAEVRQFLAGPVASVGGGLGGAYALSHVASHNKRVQYQAERAAAAHERMMSHFPKPPKLGPKGSGKALGRIKASRVAKPLMRNKQVAVAGYLAGHAVTGQVGGNLAINANLRAQRKYNKSHGISKGDRPAWMIGPGHDEVNGAEAGSTVTAAIGLGRLEDKIGITSKPPKNVGRMIARRAVVSAAPGAAAGALIGHKAKQNRERNAKIHKAETSAPLQTKRQQVQQLKRKQHAMATAALATTAGLAGTGLLVARHTPRISAKLGGHLERAAIHTSIAGGGIGAYNGIQNQRINRRDISQQRHDLGVAKAVRPPATPSGLLKPKVYRASGIRRAPSGTLVRVKASVG
jgi:hypothetical protein